MDANVDNLIIEHPKGLRAEATQRSRLDSERAGCEKLSRSEVQTLRSEMHSEFKDVKLRLGSVEGAMVGVTHETVALAAAVACFFRPSRPTPEEFQ